MHSSNLGTKYGLLSYSNTVNLGDEIQSIAARRFLPRVDYYVDREALDSFFPSESHEVKVILNGWFCHRPDRWPPSPQIRPLVVSFHISQNRGMWSGLRASDIFAKVEVREYLKRHGPIGARDYNTLELLQNWGIDSYFSGCLTLTLERPAVPKDQNLIVLNDLPDHVIKYISQITSKQLLTTQHADAEPQDIEARLRRAQDLLEIYARASCVITHRLHCALPCLAFETPVLLIDLAEDQYRFSGLNELLFHCSENTFCSGQAGYDFDRPPPNPNRYITYQKKLIACATAFGTE